jgi:hypothetical protein
MASRIRRSHKAHDIGQTISRDINQFPGPHFEDRALDRSFPRITIEK